MGPMIAFNSNDPFPLIDAASHSYTETLEHAEKVDAWLDLQVGTVEEYLAKHGWKNEGFLVSSFDLDELEKLKGNGLRLGTLFTEPP